MDLGRITVRTLGIQGPPGRDAGVTHVQPTPAAVWTITHQLLHVPGVLVTSADGHQVSGAVRHPALGTVEITFSEPVSGTARLI